MIGVAITLGAIVAAIVGLVWLIPAPPMDLPDGDDSYWEFQADFDEFEYGDQ